MPNNREWNILDLDTLDETDDGSSAIQEGDGNVLAFAVDVTVFTGTTPTLDIEVEWSGDGVNWGSAATPDDFVQITSTGVQILRVEVKAPKWRLTYAIGGTTVDLDFRVDAVEIR